MAIRYLKFWLSCGHKLTNNLKNSFMLKRILIFAISLFLISNKGLTQGIQLAAKQVDVGYIVDYQSVFGKTPSTAKIDFLKSNKVFFYKEGYYTKTHQFEDKKANVIYQFDLEKYKNHFAGKTTNKIQINEVKLSAKFPVTDQQAPAYNPYAANTINTADLVEQTINNSMPYFSTTILQTFKNDGIRAYANDGKKIDSLRYEINADITHFWVLWKKYNPAAVTVKWTIYDNYLKRNVYTVETAGASESGDLKQLLMQCMIAATKNLMNDVTVQKYLLNEVSETALGASAPMQKISIPKTIAKEGMSNAEIIKKCISATVTVKTEKGHGSGFIITQDGYIVTNKHVIEDAKNIEVIFSNGFILYPKVILESTNPDLALLKVDGKGFPVLALSVSENETGDELIVIGTPKDISLGQTVSRGIISGKREFQGSVYIQTDASINPGNSGGPILNLKGEVVAVATYKTVDAEGISFGIPVQDVIKTLNLVME